jgi:hypothetical protein
MGGLRKQAKRRLRAAHCGGRMERNHGDLQGMNEKRGGRECSGQVPSSHGKILAVRAYYLARKSGFVC